MLLQAKEALSEGGVGLRNISYLLNTMHDVTHGAFIDRTFFPSDLMICADILLDISTSVGSTENINLVGDDTIESLVQVMVL